MFVHQLNNLTFPILVNKEKKKKKYQSRTSKASFIPKIIFEFRVEITS